MSIDETMADAITTLDPAVKVLSGYVVAYTYLGDDGEEFYGVRFGGDTSDTSMIGLATVAQHHLLHINQGDEDD